MTEYGEDLEEINDPLEQLKPSENEEISLECQWYENAYPRINDYVQTFVKKSLDNPQMCYCDLPEYASDLKASIPEKDFTMGLKAKIKSFNQRLKQDNKLVLKIIDCDQVQKYFDLSYKLADDEEEQLQCKSKYKCGSEVHSIMRGVAEKQHIDLVKLQRCIVWPLHNSHGHCQAAFNSQVRKGENVFKNLVLPEPLKNLLIATLKKKITISEIRLKCIFKVITWHSEGVIILKDAIVNAMEPYKATGIQIRTGDEKSPEQIMTMSTQNEEESKAIMNSILESVKEKIESVKGKFEIKEKPDIVKDNDKNTLNLERKKVEFEDEKEDGEEEEEDEGMGMDDGANKDQDQDD